jgi:hypothetical protein
LRFQAPLRPRRRLEELWADFDDLDFDAVVFDDLCVLTACAEAMPTARTRAATMVERVLFEKNKVELPHWTLGTRSKYPSRVADGLLPLSLPGFWPKLLFFCTGLRPGGTVPSRAHSAAKNLTTDDTDGKDFHR